VGFLFSYAYQRQDVQDCLAFDLQFPGEVVNTNLHPPSIASVLSYPLRLHINLTVNSLLPASSELPPPLTRNRPWEWPPGEGHCPSLFAARLFGRDFVVQQGPFRMGNNLSLIGGRGVFNTLDRLGLVVLALGGEFFDALRRLVFNLRQAGGVPRLSRRFRSQILSRTRAFLPFRRKVLGAGLRRQFLLRRFQP